MLNLEAEVGAVFRWVCEAYGVTPKELVSESRTHPVAEARIVAYHLCRLRGMSYPRVGKVFGERDHTTVMKGCRKALKLIERDPHLAVMVVKFCAERNAFDEDALSLVAKYREEGLLKPPEQPRDYHGDKPPNNTGNPQGEDGDSGKGASSDQGLSGSGSESFQLISSDQRPDRKRARARRERFVPDGWEPNESHTRHAFELGLDLGKQVQGYRNHEFDKPKSDWDRAFHNWLDRATNFAPRVNGKPHGLVVHEQYGVPISQDKAAAIVASVRRKQES